MSPIFKSGDNGSGQILLLIVCVIFFLISVAFLFFEYCMNLMWVLVVSFIHIRIAGNCHAAIRRDDT